MMLKKFLNTHCRKNLHYFFILLIFHLSCQKSFGQNREFYGKGYEIGVNGTTLLSNLLSLNQDTDTKTPYAIYVRKHNAHSTWRLDFNTSYSTSNDVDINGIFRELADSKTDIRLGVEKMVKLSEKFSFGYGLDLLGNYQTNNSLVSGFFIDQTTVGGGLGPVIRVNFKLSKRIILSTESSLYGTMSRVTKSGNVGVPLGDPVTNYKVLLTQPQSLFIGILL